MTLIKLLVISLLIVSCGKNVKFSENKLENTSFVTSKAFERTGVLTKESPSTVQYEGKVYSVSTYSSQAAFEFINSLASGSQVNIIFTGGTNGNEVVLETVKAQ